MRLAVTFALLMAAGSALAHPPVGIVADGRGNVFYSDLAQVWRIAPDGKRTVAVPSVHTHELWLDPQGNLFGEHLWYEGERTNVWGHYVWKRDPAGRVSMVKPRTRGFLTDVSFVRDAAGNQYFADRDHGQIRRRSTDGRMSLVAGELKQMRWLYVTPGGTLYVVDGSDLVRIRAGGQARIARNIVKTSLLRPQVAFRHALMGIWTDRNENVYVADYANGDVKRIAPSGAMKTVYESTLPWSPTGGTFAPDGSLWVLETSFTNEVRVRHVVFR